MDHFGDRAGLGQAQVVFAVIAGDVQPLVPPGGLEHLFPGEPDEAAGTVGM
jgi:hypothetical protein